MTNWILQIAGAQMPASCRSPYVIIRVLEVDAGVQCVSSVRAKTVRRVVYESAAVPRSGSTPRSGRMQAEMEASAMIAQRKQIEDAAHAVTIEKRVRIQAAVAAKLESGEPLSAAEYALLG
jgi:hypothetical protein